VVAAAGAARRNDIRGPALRPAVVARRGGPPSVIGSTCQPGAAWQTWTYDVSTGVLALSNGTLCLASSVWPPVDGTALVAAPCAAGDPSQRFNLTSGSGNAISLTAAGAPAFCANLAGYGTSPGTQVWLYTCSASDCQDNCAWTAPAPAGAAGPLVNPASGLCLDAGTGPPAPHTCDPGSPAVGLPFCDGTLDLDTRIDDLWARLDNKTRVDLFSIPIQPNAAGGPLNLPSVYWDITCIAGLSPGRFSPQPNVTVFPCTTGQAASFDVDLVAAIGAATATEGRIVNQVNYRATGGTTWQGVLCDGGPLANTQHDPRWGRVSETYGEDMWLTAAMGIAATRALQNRTAPDASGVDWLLTSQVTRHFMGTHGASDLPHDAEEYILPQWREEHQMRVYGAFQRPADGGAEGVMCAISAFADAGDVPPPRNNASAGIINYVPNCVNTYLLDEKLRTEWGSDCFIQSDCCDSIDAIVSHDYVATLEEAVAAAVNAGLSASYGNPSGITAALVAALADGSISADTYEARIKRTLRTLFRVGVFDTSNPSNPYRGPWNESLLDGPDHRALARAAVARTVVMLENRAAALPLAALPPRVAVIGPFSNCTSLAGGYGGHDSDNDPYTCNYGHSYSGFMSAVSTYVSAAQEEAAAGGGTSTVTAVLGSRVRNPDGTGGLAAAAAAAAAADLVVLCLGTGTQLEVEGLDRTALTLPDAQTALVAAVVAAIPPTAKLVVFLVTAGAVDFDEPRADAVFYAPYGGEETGHGGWDVIMGRAMPAARMPVTAFRNGYLNITAPLANFNMVTATAGFPVGRTYRFFNDSAAQAATGAAAPFILHKFGFGLSYCSFTYSALAAQAQADNSVTVQVSVSAAARAAPAGGPPCREVTQVYLTLPPAAGVVTPLYSLAAFASTEIPDPGAPPTALHFTIPADALLTTWVNGTRSLAGGAYTFAVSGHLPDDVNGTARMSNVVSTTVALPWSG
jgi:beta-glucosidase-like glycosyl hydrolase